MSGPLFTRLRERIEHSAWLSHAVPIEVAGVRFTADSTSCRAGATYVDYDYAWLSALAGGDARFMDVGAGFGLTAMLCARRMRSDGRCLLIDLSRENLGLAIRNLVRAGIGDRTEVVLARAGSESRLDAASLEARRISIAAGAPAALSRLRRIRGDAGETTVDALSERFGFAPDLVKIDVEGAERHVLAGAVATVTKHKPLIQVELHSFAPMTMRENAGAVLDWCSQHGYAMWYLAKATRVRDAGALATRGRCHVLLAPLDTEYPSALRGIAQLADVTPPATFD
jgi:FkbM family methyltransferase